MIGLFLIPAAVSRPLPDIISRRSGRTAFPPGGPDPR